MPRGGWRPNSGRRPGSKNKAPSKPRAPVPEVEAQKAFLHACAEFVQSGEPYRVLREFLESDDKRMVAWAVDKLLVYGVGTPGPRKAPEGGRDLGELIRRSAEQVQAEADELMLTLREELRHEVIDELRREGVQIPLPAARPAVGLIPATTVPQEPLQVVQVTTCSGYGHGCPCGLCKARRAHAAQIDPIEAEVVSELAEWDAAHRH